MGEELPAFSCPGAVKRKREEKRLKRDQRSWENIMKGLIDLSDAEKLKTLSEKYNDVYYELRKTTSTMQTMDKQLILLQKEKDHIQSELTKHILAKAKLESLCREFQKQNKLIKDENLTRVKEEEEKRREVASNFTEKLNALTGLMDENKDKSVRLREENVSMTAKLTELYEQFHERETHLANMNRQMELQKKLSETRIKKLEVEYQNERQIWEKERQIMLENLEKSHETNCVLQENVQSLQTHIEVYKGQYSDFESTMQKSNKVFDAFKEEMEKIQKANSALEKERNEWRSRWQSATNSVVHVSELHQQTCRDLKGYEKKIAMLEKLCRQLQSDRATYIQQLKENNLVPVAPMQVEETPPTAYFSSGMPSALKKKLSKKERELLALKEELKCMESQLKDSTTKLEVHEGEPDNKIALISSPVISDTCPDAASEIKSSESELITPNNTDSTVPIPKHLNDLTRQMGTVYLHPEEGIADLSDLSTNSTPAEMKRNTEDLHSENSEDSQIKTNPTCTKETKTPHKTQEASTIDLTSSEIKPNPNNKP